MLFSSGDGVYGVMICTGPRSVLLNLRFQAQRTEKPDTLCLSRDPSWLDPGETVVRARVLEGTDEANREFGASLHPMDILYAVNGGDDSCSILRRAAYAIVERLACRGEAGYENEEVGLAETYTPQLTDAQRQELERRIADADAHPEDAIPWEQVRDEARARLRKQSPATDRQGRA